jgi:hypothetical protein
VIEEFFGAEALDVRRAVCRPTSRQVRPLDRPLGIDATTS